MVLFAFLAMILAIQCCVKFYEYLTGDKNLKDDENMETEGEFESEMARRRVDSHEKVLNNSRIGEGNMQKGNDTSGDMSQLGMVSPLTKKRVGSESYKFEFSD